MADPPALGQDVPRGMVVALSPDSLQPLLWQVVTLD
jgi:hypothetical protein